MDNYKVLKKLGKGAQGCVYLVEDKETHQQFVLKKVECNDEAQANKAFKEAVALEQLNHPYICGYKEFFIVWDSEESAIFVCIVMELYKLGDLEKVLKGRRQTATPLDQLLLKKWIGQLLEAMHYVHSRKMIHRDLKPSNIFLKDDMSITIGDFGVATVMGNIRTVTRTTVGSMSWIAPEILDIHSKYDDRSDVWSLGCVFVEMATCGFMDSVQISGVLFQLKDDPNILEDLLEKVTAQYCPQLSKLIRMCLIRVFEQRPTVADLVCLPYAQECLALSSSSLYKGEDKDGDADTVEGVPDGSDVRGVMDYLRSHSTSQKGVELGLSTLLALLSKQDTASLSDQDKRQLLGVVRDFPSSSTLQTLCCQVIEVLVATASEGDIVFTAEFIRPLLHGIRCHSECLILQKVALALITALSTDEKGAVCLGAEGGIQVVLGIMRSLSDQPSITSSCCTALWSLSVIDSNLEIMTKEKAVVDVCKALLKYRDTADIVDTVCSTLWSLSMDDANLDIMIDHGIVSVLLNTVFTFTENAGIVKFAIATLSSLVLVHELSAYQVIHTKEGLEGVPLLIKALQLHQDNPEVVETVASLFHDLSQYSEVKDELVSLKVLDNLSKVHTSSCYMNQETDATTALTEAMSVLTTGVVQPSSVARKRASSAAKQRGK